jgi:hypothetical protein
MTSGVGSAPGWYNAAYITELLNKADKDNNGLSEAELNAAVSSSAANSNEKLGYTYIQSNLKNISQGDKFVTQSEWLDFQTIDPFGTGRKSKTSTTENSSRTQEAGRTARAEGNPFEVLSR